MLGVALDAAAYLERLQEELSRVDQAALSRWSDWLFEAWRDGRFVYLLGNGGSGSTASHMAEDLGKSTLPTDALQDPARRRLKVLSLTDNASWIMAVGNDVGYEDIFVQQLMNYGKAGDIVIAISGSGNSPNVAKAVAWARQADLRVFGLTGYDGGKLKQMQDDGVHVDLADMGMVESIHLCLFHWVLNDVFARINRQGRHADAADEARPHQAE